MLWQYTLLVIFCVSSATLSAVCAAQAMLAVRNARAATASVHRRLSSIESQLTLSHSSMDEWKKLTAQLSESVKMSKIRRGLSMTASRSSVDGEPDSAQDPEAWRAWMNARLRADKFRG